MATVNQVLVRDHDGLPQLVPTSRDMILAIGAKDDPATNLPTDEASLVSLLKGILSANQDVSKASASYSVTPILVNTVTSATSLGNLKGVLFEFSYDFVGTINGLATVGSNVASRYFEAPAGGTLSNMSYSLSAGTLTIFKMTAN